MERTPVALELAHFPVQFHEFLTGAKLYDSSCSREARVYYLDKGEGFYLKTAAKGTLETEAEMTRYFHGKGLAAQVLAYESGDRDWLLTSRVAGEDCIHSAYLSDPKRLSELLGQLLRSLHEESFDGCPVPNRTQTYLDTVSNNYRAGHYDKTLFPDNWGYICAEDAWRVVQEFAPQLRADTLLHGDYCLPNVMLRDWKLSGFIDLGCGGVGDRHIDLFWGVWSLQFNLKTDAYRERFLDAYGTDAIEPEILGAIGAFEVFG